MSPVQGGIDVLPAPGNGGGSVDLGDIPGYTTAAGAETRGLRSLGTDATDALSGAASLSLTHVLVWNYTTSQYPARPAGVAGGAVQWIGPVAPTNALPFDRWDDPT